MPRGSALCRHRRSTGSTVRPRIKRFPDLAVGGLLNNPFFTRFPDLWIYAALSESGPYIGERERLPEWKERYAQIAGAANEFEKRRARSGSKLQTRIA